MLTSAWALLAAVIAIRESLDLSVQRAIVTVAFGWAAWLGAEALLYAAIGSDLLTVLST